MNTTIISLLFAAAFLFFLSAEPAFAYIDPGSGSALISIIVGAFVAVGLAIKSFWYKITGIFGSKKPPSEDIDPSK